MSLTAVTTAVTAATGSAGTEAGRQVWLSLADFTRRTLRRRGPDDGTDPLPLDPGDEEQVRSLAALLFAHLYQNPGAAAEFARWARRVRPAVTVGNSRVLHTIGGNARTGTAIQGRDITWNGPAGAPGGAPAAD
ncbi:hypothetical protein IPZ58_18720 [Streptomyces roseoverticillatus]|uniref:hypothetical protein n=1 Tax=Streptomyces roseoverticillatus TaxID=66429 RepID=UPI001F3B5B4A|nr:hypothetical protein [Streptomyces roseoverticillatus]MCF3103602.1 hypothetical protein [Streptomyces roseoverticillatus]